MAQSEQLNTPMQLRHCFLQLSCRWCTDMACLTLCCLPRLLRLLCVQHLHDKGQSGEAVEIWRALGKMTLAVVGSTAYG